MPQRSRRLALPLQEPVHRAFLDLHLLGDVLHQFVLDQLESKPVGESQGHVPSERPHLPCHRDDRHRFPPASVIGAKLNVVSGERRPPGERTSTTARARDTTAGAVRPRPTSSESQMTFHPVLAGVENLSFDNHSYEIVNLLLTIEYIAP